MRNGIKVRREKMKESSLPFSFMYKIRKAFSGEICPLCKRVMQNYTMAPNMPSVQHNQPLTKGGKHELINISIICCRCNKSVGDKETGKLNNTRVIQVWTILVSKPCTRRVQTGY